MKEGYVITSTGDDHWHNTRATSLRGAKIIATKTYQSSFNGKITVAWYDGRDDAPYAISVKYGYDKKWTDIL